MANISIFTDSTSDLTNEWLLENNVFSIPLTYIVGDEEFEDEVSDEKKKEFYDSLRNKGVIAKTSAISTDRFIQAFAKELEKGNDVFYTGLSAKLSATFNNAVLAAEFLQEKYPERKVVVTNSLATTYVTALLIEEAIKLRDAGKSVDEIKEAVDELTTNLSVWLSVDDLQHLKRGGRISCASAAIGSILNIKPILVLAEDGTIAVHEKVKGNKKVLKYFFEQIAEKAVDPVNDVIYLLHTDAPELIEELKGKLEHELNAKNIKIGIIGRVIGAHVGPGGIAIVVKTNKRIY